MHMKLLTFLISGFLLITTLVACKKSADQTTTPTPTPTPPPVTVPQGNYSGQYLTLSTVENVASPWTELKADTVY